MPEKVGSLVRSRQGVWLDLGTVDRRPVPLKDLGGGEAIEEGASRPDRELVGQRQQMSVAGDEDSTLVLGERQQIVVTGIGRAGRRHGRIFSKSCSAAQKRSECVGLVCRDAFTQFRVGECSLELCKQRLRDDQLELPGEPAREKLGRCSAAGEQCGHEDVRVENGAHSAPTRPRLVLRLDRESCCTLLSEILALPEALEQVESKFSAKRFLDHFAVALASACAANFDRPQDFLIDSQCGSHLRHIRILAS